MLHRIQVYALTSGAFFIRTPATRKAFHGDRRFFSLTPDAQAMT